jgi:signal peptidase I
MKRSRILLYLIWLIPGAGLVFYLLNPLGVPSWDPRGRVLGVIPYRVPANSMAPTYPQGSFVAACTWAYARTKPALGDVIVFWPPGDPNTPYIKRIVGIEGDTVQFSNDVFMRNGVAPNEPYVLPGAAPTGDHKSSVPREHVFVAGDNRANSRDSRHFGAVANDAIIGKVCAQL